MLIAVFLLSFLLLLNAVYCASKAYSDHRMQNTRRTVLGVIASLTALATSLLLLLLTGLSFSGV